MKRLFGLFVLSITVFGLVNCQQQNGKPEVSPTYSLQSVYFDYDRSTIRSDATEALNGNAGYLKQNENVSVTIEGNCDNRGSNEYNIALGQRRADSTKNYLANLGVSSSRMKTVTYGEERPVCHESNEACWQRNRRSDFRK